MSTALRAAVCKKLGLSATATQADVYRAALKRIGAFGYEEDSRSARQRGWDAQAGTFVSPDGRTRIDVPGRGEASGRYSLYRRPERGPAYSHPWTLVGYYPSFEAAISAA